MVSGNFIKRGVLNRSKREEQAAHPILKLTVMLLSLLAMELLLEVLLSSLRARRPCGFGRGGDEAGQPPCF